MSLSATQHKSTMMNGAHANTTHSSTDSAHSGATTFPACCNYRGEGGGSPHSSESRRRSICAIDLPTARVAIDVHAIPRNNGHDWSDRRRVETRTVLFIGSASSVRPSVRPYTFYTRRRNRRARPRTEREKITRSRRRGVQLIEGEIVELAAWREGEGR